MVIIFMGVSGSGKTTIGKKVASRLEIPFYEGDDFHSQHNIKKMANGVPLTDEDREDWLAALEELIRAKFEQGESGVIACSALKNNYREQLRVDPEKVIFIYLKGSYELIYTRMQKRSDHYMDPKMLKSQFQDLEEPKDVFLVNVGKSPDKIVQEIMAYLSEVEEGEFD